MSNAMSDKKAALAMAEVFLDSSPGSLSYSAVLGALRRVSDALARETEAEATVAPSTAVFNIPTIGTDVTLTDDWKLLIEPEYRNESALALFFGEDVKPRTYGGNREAKARRVALPSGTVLRVDRIYIRKGAGDFDSVTFSLIDSPRKEWAPKSAGGTRKGKCRFWVALPQINGLPCSMVAPKDEAVVDAG